MPFRTITAISLTALLLILGVVFLLPTEKQDHLESDVVLSETPNITQPGTRTQKDTTGANRQAPKQVARKQTTSLSAEQRIVLFGDIESGNLRLTRQYIENGGNIELKDEDGRSLLSQAILAEREELVTMLLAKGANIHSTDRDGKQPIHYAVAAENPQFMEDLLTRKADINAMSAIGETPLHVAINSGNPALVQTIIDRNADVTVRQKSKEHIPSPILLAIINGEEKMVDLLLKANPALALSTDVLGTTAIRHAQLSGYDNITELLRTHGATSEL